MITIKPDFADRSRILTLTLLLLAVAPCAQSETPSQRLAEFCEACTTAAAAKQRAWFLAPLVHCDWPRKNAESPTPPDLKCSSSDREVLLVNPHTREVYTYRLTYNPESNSHLLEEWAMPPELSEAASVALDIHEALTGFQFSRQVQGHEVNTLPGYSFPGEEECPQGTALDHALNPGMRQWMFDRMHSDWMEVMQAFQQSEPNVSRTTGISVSLEPTRLTVAWGSGGAPINRMFRARFIFTESEVSTSPPLHDLLVFDVHEFLQLGNSASMNIEFNKDLSRAAGYSVNTLLSEQIELDNPCVLQKHQEHRPSKQRISPARRDSAFITD